MRILALILALLTLPAQTATPQPIIIPIGSDWRFGPSSGVTSSGLYAGYGGSFSQTLSVSPKTVQAPSPGWQYGTEGVYTLTFSTLNWFPNYPGYYTAEIDFGSQELCEASGWGTSKHSQVTITCPASNYIVLDKALPLGGPNQGNQNFVLHFTVAGWPILFDKVALTFMAANP